jgi:molybdopterin-containing oxidoreductase family membrane subunit
MWLERFLIIIPTLSLPRLPADLPHTVGVYIPTSTEWKIMAASAAIIVLLYMFFTKLFPIISVWEIREEREAAEEEHEELSESDELLKSPLARRSS